MLRFIVFLIFSISFCPSFGQGLSTASELPDGLVADFDASQSTLIHLIRVHRIEDWKREFLQKYIEHGGPPKEWIRVGPWHGIMVNDMQRVDLESLDYETAIRHSFYYGELDDAEYHRRRTQQKFAYIVFVANPRPDATWLMAGPRDESAKRFRRQWWLNPRNWFRSNDFFFNYLVRMWSDWRMPFRHSAMYDDVKAIGHVKAFSGRTIETKKPAEFVGPGAPVKTPIYTAVVTNEKMFESTKLMIPKELSPTGESIVISSGPGGRSCGDLFVRTDF